MSNQADTEALSWLNTEVDKLYSASLESWPEVILKTVNTTIGELQLENFWYQKGKDSMVHSERQIVSMLIYPNSVLALATLDMGMPSITLGISIESRPARNPNGTQPFREYRRTKGGGLNLKKVMTAIENFASVVRGETPLTPPKPQPKPQPQRPPETTKPDIKLDVLASEEPIAPEKRSGALYEIAPDGDTHSYVMIPLVRLPNLAAKIVIDILETSGTSARETST